MAGATGGTHDDPLADFESNEVLENSNGETRAGIEVAEERLEIGKKFSEESQTHTNLENKIPKNINYGDEELGENVIPLDNNKKLLQRITKKVEDLATAESQVKLYLKNYGKDFLGYEKIEDIPNGQYDIVIQQLAIIAAAHSDDFIHLDPIDRKQLANILLPEVSREPLHLTKVSESTEVLSEGSVLREHPAYPYIERMLFNGTITQKEFNTFVEQFEKSGSLENMDLSLIHPAIQKIIEIVNMDEESLKERNTKLFLAAFGNHTTAHGDKYADIIEYSPAIQLIAENYMEIPIDQSKTLDPEVDFYTAVDVAANKIRWGVKNIDRSTERYKKAVADTKNIDKNTQLHGISELLAIQGIHEGGPALTVKKKEDEITKLLKKSHKNAEEGRLHKKQKADNAGFLEQNDSRGSNPDDVLKGLDNLDAANDHDYNETPPSVLASGDKEIEVGDTDTTSSYGQAA